MIGCGASQNIAHVPGIQVIAGDFLSVSLVFSMRVRPVTREIRASFALGSQSVGRKPEGDATRRPSGCTKLGSARSSLFRPQIGCFDRNVPASSVVGVDRDDVDAFA